MKVIDDIEAEINKNVMTVFIRYHEGMSLIGV